MPSYPSSTCATHGSIKSSYITTKTSSSHAKNKKKSKSQSGRTPTTTSSSQLRSNTNAHKPAPSAEVLTSDRSPFHQHNYSTTHHTAEHLAETSYPSSIAALSHYDTTEHNKQGLRLTADHTNQVSCSVSSSVIFDQLHDSSTEYDYSITRFTTEASDLLVDTFISAEDIIQAHSTAMKMYLDDFDTIFCQD